MKYKSLTDVENSVLEKVKNKALDGSEPRFMLEKLRDANFIFEHNYGGQIWYTLNEDENARLLALPRFNISARHHKAVAYCYDTNTLILELKPHEKHPTPLSKYLSPIVYKFENIPTDLYDELLLSSDFEKSMTNIDKISKPIKLS